MTRPGNTQLVRALAALVALTALVHAHARFEWRDVVQDVRILADGGVEVRDERTLWTDEDFGEAFVCVRLAAGQTLTLLPGETGAISPGPNAVGLTQSCAGGTEVFVRQDARVRERRVRFAYRLDGVLDVYSDVVQWYWNILERDDRPVVLGYRLRVTAPGPMAEPYDAFVMRYANPEEPTVVLSPDRRVLEVAFRRVPPSDGVEIRYLMDPALFDERGTRAGLAIALEDQLRVVGDHERARFWRALRSHPAWALLPAAGVAYLVMGILGAYRRVGREPDVMAMQYPFEPPRDVLPAAVATVMRQEVQATSLGPAWFATIMDLARRGFLRFEGEGRKLVVHIEQEPADDPLEGFERAVLTYIGNAARSGRSGRRDPNSITIAELSSYGQSNAQRFLASFGRQVKAWAEGYYGGPYLTPESLKERNRWTVRSLLVGLAIGAVIAATSGWAMALSIAAAGLCLVLLIVASATLPAWTPEMAREHAAWKGFKRTLTDYTRMKDAPPDFFMLWDRYYVYAAALGVAERYLSTLRRAAPAAGMDQRSMATRGTWLGVANARDLGQMSRSISSLSSALARSGASASSGGSSSGGGGGGGGGSSGGR